MERGEDTLVVGAIGWLAQTILASLLAGKLEAWIGELGLADDIDKLKSEIERVEMVAAAVKGRAAGNRPLARALARLRELLYDADDAIDELDYYRLKHQVEGGTFGDPDRTGGHGGGQEQVDDRSRGNAGIPGSSGPWKPRSPAWEHFKVTKHNGKGKPAQAECNYCQIVLQCGSKGTSLLSNHLKSNACKEKRGANTSSTTDGAANGTPIAIGDSGSRKRMRMHEVSTHVPAVNTHHRNKAEFSNRIQQIARQLQDIRGAVSEVANLCGSSSVPSSNHHWSTSSNRPLRTSSPIQRNKMFGRFVEKDTIIKLMEAGKSDSITVLPIVGTGGIGKTALAQFAYNCSDPRVENLFDHRIWVSVSNNFDEVRLTREMLDFASQERHEGISSFAKLQEILKKCMELKRFLLILDDVWDGVHDYQWEELLAPLMSNHTKGNVVLVTTRNLSVAKRMGTVGPINLGALEHDDFLFLLKACIFGDNKYEEHQSLNTIGQNIAEKLYGNPLAAETAGKLLKHLNIDHWNTILKNEAWKSLEISRGIISVLKISLDNLPYHLQQCFLYCSIFPSSYQFSAEELIQIWISQGFVYHGHSSKTIEEIGQDYLVDLVDSGFFTPKKSEWNFMFTKDKRYVIPDLMRDLARKVSRTECANIDGRECNEMEPTVRHLSIGSGFACHGDQGENNEYFEKNMLKAAKSIKKLRSLVLFGQYGSSFFQSFQHMFKEARNLRLLKISATYADFNSFLCNLVNPTHIRYLKLEGEEDHEALPETMSKFYHLQILNVGSQTCHSEIGYEPSTDTETEEERWPVDDTDHDRSSEPCANIAREVPEGLEQHHLLTTPTWLTTSLISLQTLRIECCGKLQTLPSLERLPFLRKFELRNMLNMTEIPIPSLEELVLDEMPKLERCSCTSVRDLNSCLRVLKIMRCPVLKVFPLFESSQKFEMEQKSWLSSLVELIIHECPRLLVPHPLPPSSSVSKLSIRRVSTLTTIEGSSSEELTIGVPGFYDFDGYDYELRTLDGKMLSFHNLRFLTKLEVYGCQNLTSISFEGFRQLISLKIFEIVFCEKLFSSHVLPEDTHEDMAAAECSALPSLECLRIDSCGITGKWLSLMLRHVQALQHLDLLECEQITTWLSVQEEENSQSDLISGTGRPDDTLSSSAPEASSSSSAPAPEGLLRIPLNLVPSLKKISIAMCRDLTFRGSKDGLAGFTSLEELHIWKCRKLLSSLANGRLLLPQSLVQLALQDYCLETLQPCFPGNLTGLKKLQVSRSPGLKSLELRYCTALEELKLEECESLAAIQWLQSLGRLRHLKVYGSPNLKHILLHLCTALEDLRIDNCRSLGSVKGFQILHGIGGLRRLEVSRCPGLRPCSESLSLRGYELCARLETLRIDDLSVLTTSFCKHLTSLQHLELLGGCRGWWNDVTRLTDEQERALQLLTTLRGLHFCHFYKLVHLPVCLHSLASLKRMEICYCQSISRLPEKGLPPSLEELVVSHCHVALNQKCRALATRKLKVRTTVYTLK